MVSSCVLAGFFCVLPCVVLQILTICTDQWGQSKGSSNTKHECVSISNQPDLFLTDQYSQDFHSLFGHHIKTLLQRLSIMCWLDDNLL